MRDASVEEIAQARQILRVSEIDLEANRQGRLSERQVRSARLGARFVGALGLVSLGIASITLAWRGWGPVVYGGAGVGALVLLVAGMFARQARDARAYAIDGYVGTGGVNELRIGGRPARTIESARLAPLLVGKRVRAYVDTQHYLLAVDPPPVAESSERSHGI